MASLARDIRFDPAKLFHEDGRPKMPYELDEDTRVALRGFKRSSHHRCPQGQKGGRTQPASASSLEPRTHVTPRRC